MKRRLLLVLAILSLVSTAGTNIGASDLSLVSTTGPHAGPSDFRKISNVRIPMRDGVSLAADLYLPAGEGRFPAILIRTPYRKEQMKILGEVFAKRGYATVVQDVRGKWSSDEKFVAFVSERSDGLETLDWIVGQPWCDGQIGMWGSSYLAFCALVLAAEPHEALKTVFANSAWLDGSKIHTPGGALHWMLMLTWSLHEATEKKRSLANYDLDSLFEYIPLKGVMRSVGIHDPIWENPDTLEGLEFDYSRIQIPIFHITGWNDFVYTSALEVYDRVSKRGTRVQKLLVGPWVHDQVWTEFTEVGDEDFGNRSIMGFGRMKDLALRWFDRWLRDVDNGITEEPPVNVFMMGANEWRTYEHWPPENVAWEKWFIESDGRANTLNGDGRLVRSQPERSSPYDTFVFDPMNPVPTTGGANFHFFSDNLGVKDQRGVESREDVLVYTSAPLEHDLEMAGPVEAVIYVSTDGRDTDFTAKLVEVRSDGYARNIVEGIRRASLRNSLEVAELLEAGRIYELKIELGATAIRIPRGHRVRLEISSSNFPKYDRNPNTGEHPWYAVEYRRAVQKVFHSEEHVSHIVLPVLRPVNQPGASRP